MTDDSIELSDIESMQQWADIVIERWEKRISRLRIHSSGALAKSFTSQVEADSNGNPQKVIFTFNYYGRFVDLGVGRGVPIAKVPESKRTPKPWYNKTFFKEIHKLTEIFAERYGKTAANAIKVLENDRKITL